MLSPPESWLRMGGLDARQCLDERCSAPAGTVATDSSLLRELKPVALRSVRDHR